MKHSILDAHVMGLFKYLYATMDFYMLPIIKQCTVLVFLFFFAYNKQFFYETEYLNKIALICDRFIKKSVLHTPRTSNSISYVTVLSGKIIGFPSWKYFITCVNARLQYYCLRISRADSHLRPNGPYYEVLQISAKLTFVGA